MAIVSVKLPKLLEMVLPTGAVATVEGATLREALVAIVEAHPELQAHLFDESGEFRQHVLCFLNATNTRWLTDSEVSLADGDELLFMQAVSGG